MKCFLLILHFSLLLFHTSIALAIEVGGHITEDTTWSPENNPHLVTSGVYVNNGVTLTILPGTVIKFNSAYYNEISDDEFYFSGGEEPEAKFIRCEGRIIAEGTEQESIIFTRMQDEQYYHWGTVYLAEDSDLSIFKHCKFEYSAVTGFSLSEQIRAAIAIWNGIAIVEDCVFIDNDKAIHIKPNLIEISICNNSFFDIIGTLPNTAGLRFIDIGYVTGVDTGIPLIAGNTFINNTAIDAYKSIFFVDNYINDYVTNGIGADISHSPRGSYFYGNLFDDCYNGLTAFCNDEDTLYIKKNNYLGGVKGIDIHHVYAEISDNYFEGCKLNLSHSYSSKIVNNIISDSGGIAISVNVDIFSNNVVVGCNRGFSGGGTSQFANNIFINNISAFSSFITDNHIIENEIILFNEELISNPQNIYGNPIFRNCILDFELPVECIDGGGNIWVDSLQALQIFEDIENGNFRLAPGSIAIDAGFDTLGYYYPFDMDYSARVWDGDNNGTPIIDIGPYEYGAPQFGKISGYITETESAAPVHYVLLKIDNEPGNFTFTDSVGYYEIQLPNGTYDIYAKRVFYEDNVIYSVTVEDEQTTELNFNMTTTLPQVGIAEEELSIHHSTFKISNYPNPFNPSTTIHFSNELFGQNEQITLEIYNIKGQKIRQFNIHNSKLKINEVVWDGTDDFQKPVSSGIYFYKISTGKEAEMSKMLLLK
jgi:hypothetical protein